MASNLVVFFDGACPLCQREIAMMRRLDQPQAICFIDVADPSTTCPVDRAELLARFHAVENGKLLSGARAFAAMWRAIPILRPLGIVADLPWARPLFESAYRGFLRIRPRLQRFFA